MPIGAYETDGTAVVVDSPTSDSAMRRSPVSEVREVSKPSEQMLPHWSGRTDAELSEMVIEFLLMSEVYHPIFQGWVVSGLMCQYIVLEHCSMHLQLIVVWVEPIILYVRDPLKDLGGVK